MRNSRIAGLVACLFLGLSAVGCASAAGTSQDRPTTPVDVGVAVPAHLTERGSIEVGIACDYPPFGYTDMEGKNAGYDAEVARTLAAYAFGDDSEVNFTCVTPQNRIPYLETRKIDLIVSTLGYTKERDETIDYSVPYFTSGAKLLVPRDSDISGWDDIEGKPVLTKQGTTSSTFLTNCYPGSEQLLLDSTSDILAALNAGRATAFAEDSTLLLGLSLNNSALKVVGDDKARTPWGIGIRQGDSESKSWVDAVLADLTRSDGLWRIFTDSVGNDEAVQTFAQNMPRPSQSIEYTDKDTLSDCS